MANLMLTKQCNLHCSYCFANEFVNQQNDIMSYDNFLKCLQFLSADPNERIGLIGGEPTLHPELKHMLATLIDSPFRSVCLFTNGIVMEPYFNELRNSKFLILINLNEPNMVGIQQYYNIIKNCEQMIERFYMRDQVNFGINLYKPNMDFEYILDVLKRFQQRKLRVSVSVPNMDETRQMSPLEYFQKMKDTVRGLVKNLLEIGVAPQFDCNYVPYCVQTEEDRALFAQHSEVMQRSNLTKNPPICSPVLDILPDLQVVRCFGLSGLYKVNLLDFRNAAEIRKHFAMEIDALAYHIVPNEDCGKCQDYIAGKCSCGCYAYRQANIKMLRDGIKQKVGVTEI